MSRRNGKASGLCCGLKTWAVVSARTICHASSGCSCRWETHMRGSKAAWASGCRSFMPSSNCTAAPLRHTARGLVAAASSSFGCLPSAAKQQSEYCPFTCSRFAPHGAAVALHDAAYVRQSHARALELRGAVQSLERGEQALRVRHVKADAVVADPDFEARGRV